LLNAGVVVSNSNMTLMNFTRRLLVNLSYQPGKMSLNMQEGARTNLAIATKPGWLLRLSNIEDVERFSAEIPFADSVKQEKLVDALALIRKHGRKDAANFWLQLYEKGPRQWVKKTNASS
jgi:hypothetical protein